MTYYKPCRFQVLYLFLNVSLSNILYREETKSISRRKLMERTSRSRVGAAQVSTKQVGKVVERAEQVAG